MLSRSKPWDGEDDPVSFIKKAQEAAAQAAEVARARAQEAAAVANRTAADPATAETLAKSARDAVGMARRGVTTVIEKIDPSTLADLIIKATALQEMSNYGSSHRVVICALIGLGRLDEARTAARRLLDAFPTYTLTLQKEINPWRDQAFAERYVDALRIAGIPE